MTYLYRVLRDSPIGIWPLDGNVLDQSGFDKNGTVTGTLSANRPIVAGGISCYQFDGTDKLTLPISKVMKSGKPFSLEVWYKPDVIAGTAALLARDNSGIFASGSSISFNLDFDTPISATFDRVEVGNIYHIVAVYDGVDAYINVNSEVNAVPVLAGSVFGDTSNNLRIEASNGSVFTVDSPAVYNYALKESTIRNHYALGRYWAGVSDISGANGANVYRLWDGNTNLKQRIHIDTETDWREGGITGGAAIIGDVLTHQYDDATDAYLSGTWNYSYLFPDEDLTVSGARLSWDANVSNLSVEVSTDGGIVYRSVANGGEAFGAQSLNDEFEVIVRVNLPAGQTKATVYNLTLAVYTSKDVFGTDEDLPMAVSDEPNVSVAEFDHNPASFNNNTGMTFKSSNAGIFIPTDAEFGSYRAVEMTVYPDTLPTSGTILKAGSATLTANGSGQWVASGLTSLFVNGQNASLGSPITIDAKKHTHIIAVFPAYTGGLYLFNSNTGTAGYRARLGYVATYYNIISAADAASIYGAWVGAPAIRLTDTNSVDIFEHNYAETALPFRGYALTWSISAAG